MDDANVLQCRVGTTGMAISITEGFATPLPTMMGLRMVEVNFSGIPDGVVMITHTADHDGR